LNISGLSSKEKAGTTQPVQYKGGALMLAIISKTKGIYIVGERTHTTRDGDNAIIFIDAFV
jgi:hypothetical protein